MGSGPEDVSEAKRRDGFELSEPTGAGVAIGSPAEKLGRVAQMATI
jgi:hypothetical protein